jgi:cytochrome c peroxidase
MKTATVPTKEIAVSRRWLGSILAGLLATLLLSAQGPVPTWNVDTHADSEPISPIPPPPPADPRKLALGAHLFEDWRLYRRGGLACSSCHDTRTNGAARPQGDATPHGARLSSSTLTVFNAALNYRLDWEGDFRTLEDQIAASLGGPGAMSKNVDAALRALDHENGMPAQFQMAYGHGPDRSSLLDAVATYERSLLTPGSKFDRWLGGDARALTTNQLDGYRLFKSFGCISCHQGVNIGGNLFEKSGIFHPLIPDQSKVLRVPSLRNVAVIGPYFHDGSVATLESAVRKMGEAQLDRALSDVQINAIVAFLGTLTGFDHGRELTAPP